MSTVLFRHPDVEFTNALKLGVDVFDLDQTLLLQDFSRGKWADLNPATAEIFNGAITDMPDLLGGAGRYGIESLSKGANRHEVKNRALLVGRRDATTGTSIVWGATSSTTGYGDPFLVPSIMGGTGDFLASMWFRFQSPPFTGDVGSNTICFGVFGDGGNSSQQTLMRFAMVVAGEDPGTNPFTMDLRVNGGATAYGATACAWNQWHHVAAYQCTNDVISGGKLMFWVNGNLVYDQAFSLAAFKGLSATKTQNLVSLQRSGMHWQCGRVALLENVAAGGLSPASLVAADYAYGAARWTNT